MNLMQTTKLEVVGKTVLLVILLPGILARPHRTQRNDNRLLRSEMAELDDNSMNKAELQQAVNSYLYNKEYKDLRTMLELAIRTLDDENQHVDASEVLRNSNIPDMPFYFDHIKSLVSNRGVAIKRRHQRRRRGFDSIAHRAGGLGGLGGSYSYTGRRVEYTLEQLLPFIIAELRRNKQFSVSELNF